jgi:plasmid stability protein
LVAVAQLLVRNLDAGVKEALRRRARSHGRSMEEEARLILAQATQGEGGASTAVGPGLGSRMAMLFAGLGLEDPIEPWQGHEAEPADFGS